MSRVTEQENEAICAKLLSSLLHVPWCCRPVATGRAGRESQPIGPCHSVLVVDARPAENEPRVASKAFWAVRRS